MILELKFLSIRQGNLVQHLSPLPPLSIKPSCKRNKFLSK